MSCVNAPASEAVEMTMAMPTSSAATVSAVRPVARRTLPEPSRPSLPKTSRASGRASHSARPTTRGTSSVTPSMSSSSATLPAGKATSCRHGTA
jgi:hypothetical protein